MVAKTGWKHYQFKNAYGESLGIRIHAGRKIGRGYIEDENEGLQFRIRKNRIIDAVILDEDDFALIAGAWKEATGQDLARPLFNRIVEFAKECAADIEAGAPLLRNVLQRKLLEQPAKR